MNHAPPGDANKQPCGSSLADDLGMCHTVNAAILRSFMDGVACSPILMAPCPWALHAMEEKGPSRSGLACLPVRGQSGGRRSSARQSAQTPVDSVSPS